MGAVGPLVECFIAEACRATGVSRPSFCLLHRKVSAFSYSKYEQQLQFVVIIYVSV